MSRRGHIIRALREAPYGVSGEALAEQLEMSRAAVAKHVSALRVEGYDITGAPGRGYRLLSSPDVLTPAEVASRLHSDVYRLTGGGVTASTNDDARALARDGEPEYAVALASRQLAGRGRLGRTWDSPPGGVYLSIVLRPKVAPVDAASLSLVAGVAVAEALEGFGFPALVKWPNDVLVGGAKVAGISLETASDFDRLERAIVGIGINVAEVEGRSGTPGALTADDGTAPPLAEVTARVLDAFHTRYEQWKSVGFGWFATRFVELDALSGQEVAVRTLEGEILAQGIAAGVDEGGRLLVTAEDGTVTPVASGDVTLRG